MIKKITQTALDRKYLTLRPYTASPINADFLKLVVTKPWGSEYLLFSNPSVEIWNLHINHLKATSMHCHPNKKTALMVLDGKVLFSSLNESTELSSGDAVVIEAGAFHSTQALSGEGAYVLEFETPPMKHDLVRLEDKYGRAQSGYEGVEKMVPSDRHIRFSSNEPGTLKNFCNSTLMVRSIKDAADAALLEENGAVSVIVSGTVFSKAKDPVYTVGDITSLTDLKQFGHFYDDVSIFYVNKSHAAKSAFV
jgi:mannose-6-phosphate isomerase-like protein (cupin superfamily)